MSHFPDKELSGPEILEILRKANEGDPESYAILLHYVRYAKPNDMCPPEFLSFLGMKGDLIARHKDTSLLIQSHKRKRGRNSMHLTMVKMVYFWVLEGEKVVEAIRKVAEHTKSSEVTVHDAYYKWPKGKRNRPNCAPHEYVKKLGWDEQIIAYTQYALHLDNILAGKDTPVTLQEIIKVARRSKPDDLLG